MMMMGIPVEELNNIRKMKIYIILKSDNIK